MKIAGIVSIIGIIITIAVFGIIFTMNPNSDFVEVENTLDKEIRPNEETTPEIQSKLDEIEKKKLENTYSPKEREWITSGPFQIDRSEYRIGEKIFLRIEGLTPNEKGEVVFFRPLNNTHHDIYISIPFDGSQKSAFNNYLQPQLSKNRGYCTVDDFIGNWVVGFRGVNYPNLEFKINEKIIPGDEDSYEKLC